MESHVILCARSTAGRVDQVPIRNLARLPFGRWLLGIASRGVSTTVFWRLATGSREVPDPNGGFVRERRIHQTRWYNMFDGFSQLQTSKSGYSSIPSMEVSSLGKSIMFEYKRILTTIQHYSPLLTIINHY